jgi:hypothetical protein
MSKEAVDQKLIDGGFIEGKKSFEHLAKIINEEFKWKNVHKAMKALNWCWYMGSNVAEDNKTNDNMGIPSISTLKNAAFKLLKQAYDEEKAVGSGGFWAYWEDGGLCLTFTLEEASTN